MHVHEMADWLRAFLVEDILPNWLRCAPTEEGLYLPHLDRQWRQSGDEYGSLVSQGRLVYCFSAGYELTGEAAYRQAAESGSAFLLDAFRDGENGGWFYSCTRDGGVLDATKDSYGHAFVVFGLSHAARVLGSEDCRRGAAEAWDVVKSRMTDERGGIVCKLSADFGERLEWDDRGRLNSQNPTMHLFEALLALGDLEGMEHIREDAQAIADRVLGRLMRTDAGCLPELYDEQWEELPEERRGYINIGHQFEWAFLLSSAVERGFPEDYVAHARVLLDYGLSIGRNAESGCIYTGASPAGILMSPRIGWWEQCEAIRALMHHAVLRGREDLLPPLDGTFRFFRDEIVDPEYGGCYHSATHRNKGSLFKVDYHTVAMCTEAVRLMGS